MMISKLLTTPTRSHTSAPAGSPTQLTPSLQNLVRADNPGTHNTVSCTQRQELLQTLHVISDLIELCMYMLHYGGHRCTCWRAIVAKCRCPQRPPPTIGQRIRAPLLVG